MEKTIRYYRENVYGNELFYPLDCVEAIRILTEKKTLTPRVWEGLEKLGFQFVEVLKPKGGAA